MAVADKVVGLIPTKLKNRILNSPVERILTPVFLFSSDFKMFEFRTPKGDIKISLPTSVAFSNVATRGDLYEEDLVTAMADSEIKDGAFFDVGARYGFSSRAAALCGVTETNIHAFEASYLNFRILQQNLQNSQIIHGRIGDGNGKTLSLTDYTRNNNLKPAGIKIDVEGAERSVLQGLQPVLDKFKPVLFIEVHPQKFGTQKASELMIDLSKRGYDILVADHHGSNSEWIQYNHSKTDDILVQNEFLVWCR